VTNLRRMGWLLSVGVLAIGLQGCSRQEEGPAEKAGKAADDAMRKAGEKMNDAAGQMHESMQKAGEEMGKATQEMGQAMKDAGKKMGKDKEEEEDGD